MSGVIDPQGRYRNRRSQAALPMAGQRPLRRAFARASFGFRPGLYRRGAWIDASLPNPLRRMLDFVRRSKGAP